MEDFAAFTQGERAVLEALNRHGVRFMLVELSAAVLQAATEIWLSFRRWKRRSLPCAHRVEA
jgi:hypothetical protein